MNRSIGLGSGDRRAIMIGFLTIAAFTVLFRGVPAYAAWRENVEMMAVRQLGDYRLAHEKMSRFELVLDSLEARRERLATYPPLLVAGDSHAAAAANLSGALKSSATVAGVRLGPTQIQHDTVGGQAFQWLSIRADAVGGTSQIAQFLAALEVGPPALRVEEWTIGRAGSPEMDIAVDVRLEFTARAIMVRPQGR